MPTQTQRNESQDIPWQQTACILCSLNCGLEIQVKDRHFIRVRGDKAHPVSEGYLCQKPARLDYYQNHARRVKQPMKRDKDGEFHPISWDTAIREIADKLNQIIAEHGGHAIGYYGGGGQGNHLPGMYAAALRAGIGTPYAFSALAQEKTGDFWVNGKLFGRQTCHVTEGIHESDYVILIGTNSWQSHGFPQTRKVLRELKRDPNRTLVVIDPRRTATAQMADIHIPVKPGMDAFLMLAILATIVQEGWENNEFLANRTIGFEQVRAVLQGIDVVDYAAKAEVPLETVRQVAHGLAHAKAASTRHDLGVEHSLHSTLNTYLEKLLFLITGNFGRPGTNNLHNWLLSIMGHTGGDKLHQTRVTGTAEISKLYPPNVLAAEIDNDHPDRIRGMIVDSGNPMQTVADTQALGTAFDKLELLVVIDVALTESAEKAHYILPASTQYEKWEATFFTGCFPTNYFHLRRPILEPDGNTLPEPEIYHRLAVAMGLLPDQFPDLEKYAHQHRAEPEYGIFPVALQQYFNENPKQAGLASLILYSTLGKALPDGAQSAAALWGVVQFFAQRYKKQVQRAGYEGRGHMLGEALFNAILESDTAVSISTHTYEEVNELIRHPDSKIHLAIPEMLAEIEALALEESVTNGDFPLILAAGERREYNANQIYRTPEWRKKDQDGALRINPTDAKMVGVIDGEAAVCESAHGAIDVFITVEPEQRIGFVSLPHGYGQEYPDMETEELVKTGPRINILTAADHCDPIAKTPYHKYVPVRVKPIK